MVVTFILLVQRRRGAKKGGVPRKGVCGKRG